MLKYILRNKPLAPFLSELDTHTPYAEIQSLMFFRWVPNVRNVFQRQIKVNSASTPISAWKWVELIVTVSIFSKGLSKSIMSKVKYLQLGVAMRFFGLKGIF